MDLWAELYHRVCFPFYRIPYLNRKEYIRIDRHKLKYLDPMQKLNCIYCGYANGLAKYWVRLFAETEAYWCGIQHKKSGSFIPPEHHADFPAYGDREAFYEAYNKNKTRMF
jgi:hypothetical protein